MRIRKNPLDGRKRLTQRPLDSSPGLSLRDRDRLIVANAVTSEGVHVARGAPVASFRVGTRKPNVSRAIETHRIAGTVLRLAPGGCNPVRVHELHRRCVGAAHRRTVLEQLQCARKPVDRQSRRHQTQPVCTQIYGVAEQRRIDIEKLLLVGGLSPKQDPARPYSAIHGHDEIGK